MSIKYEFKTTDIYGVRRLEAVSPQGEVNGLWRSSIGRRGRFKFDFYDRVWGGKDSAMHLALAWRDAFVRLAPPITKREFQKRLRTSNTTGIVGVSIRRVNGKALSWVASVQNPAGHFRKTFSIKIYGDKAKEMAIAAREELLDTYGEDAFFNTKKESEEPFEHLLKTSDAPISDLEIKRRIEALNEWFNNLRPERICVSVNVHSRKVFLHISTTGLQPKHGVKLCRSITVHRTYEQLIPELWKLIEDFITSWYGLQRWLDFASQHERVFMSNAQNGFLAHHYLPPAGYPMCLKLPQSLAPLLPDFHLPPEISYLRQNSVPCTRVEATNEQQTFAQEKAEH